MSKFQFLCRPALAVAILFVGGCGFAPLLGQREGGAITDDLAQIRILPIADRSGQMLRTQLEDQLRDRGRPAGGSLYTLEIRLSEPRQEIAVRRDESASRIAYSANANFVLRDNAGGALFGGSSSSSSTFEATTSEFASIAGQLSARDRAIEELSADIRRQLASYFSQMRRGAQSSPAGTPR